MRMVLVGVLLVTLTGCDLVSQIIEPLASPSASTLPLPIPVPRVTPRPIPRVTLPPVPTLPPTPVPSVLCGILPLPVVC